MCFKGGVWLLMFLALGVVLIMLGVVCKGGRFGFGVLFGWVLLFVCWH